MVIPNKAMFCLCDGWKERSIVVLPVPVSVTSPSQSEQYLRGVRGMVTEKSVDFRGVGLRKLVLEK